MCHQHNKINFFQQNIPVYQKTRYVFAKSMLIHRGTYYFLS